MATKTLAFLALPVLLAGCSLEHQWTPAPGHETADYAPEAAKCRLYARSNTPDITVIGPPLMIAAASIRHDEDTAHTFDDCMIVAGWRIVK